MSHIPPYLQAGYDPKSATVPQLRKILTTENIDFSISAKKSELVHVFETQLRPNIPARLKEWTDVEPSENGVLEGESYGSSLMEIDTDPEEEISRRKSLGTKKPRRATRSASVALDSEPEMTKTPRASRVKTKTGKSEGSVKTGPTPKPTPRRSKAAVPVVLALPLNSKSGSTKKRHRVDSDDEFQQNDQDDMVVAVEEKVSKKRKSAPKRKSESGFSDYNPFQSGAEETPEKKPKRKSTPKPSRKSESGFSDVNAFQSAAEETPVSSRKLKTRKSESGFSDYNPFQSTPEVTPDNPVKKRMKRESLEPKISPTSSTQKAAPASLKFQPSDFVSLEVSPPKKATPEFNFKPRQSFSVQVPAHNSSTVYSTVKESASKVEARELKARQEEAREKARLADFQRRRAERERAQEALLRETQAAMEYQRELQRLEAEAEQLLAEEEEHKRLLNEQIAREKELEHQRERELRRHRVSVEASEVSTKARESLRRHQEERLKALPTRTKTPTHFSQAARAGPTPFRPVAAIPRRSGERDVFDASPVASSSPLYKQEYRLDAPLEVMAPTEQKIDLGDLEREAERANIEEQDYIQELVKKQHKQGGYGLLYMVLTVLGIYIAWWSAESHALGFCDVNGENRMTAQRKAENLFSYAIPKLQLSQPLLDYLEPIRPGCTKCPEKGTCRDGKFIGCDKDFLVVESVFSSVWPVRLISCTPDTEKLRAVTMQVFRAEQYLAVHRGGIICDGFEKMRKEAGKSDPWVYGVDRKALMEVLADVNLGPSFNKEMLKEINQMAIKELSTSPRIEDALEDGEWYFTTNYEVMPWSCKVKLSAWSFFERIAHYVGLVAVLFVVYFGGKTYIETSKEEQEEVARLVDRIFTGLKEKARSYDVDPILAKFPYMSAINIRDDFYKDYSGSSARLKRLWKKVEHVVEKNSNVRVSDQDVEGEPMRTWRWINPNILSEPSQKRLYPSLPST